MVIGYLFSAMEHQASGVRAVPMATDEVMTMTVLTAADEAMTMTAALTAADEAMMMTTALTAADEAMMMTALTAADEAMTGTAAPMAEAKNLDVLRKNTEAGLTESRMWGKIAVQGMYP